MEYGHDVFFRRVHRIRMTYQHPSDVLMLFDTRFLRISALVLLLTFTLTACDSNDAPTNILESSFEMTVTGNGIDETYSGNAYWANAEDGQGQQAFIVSFSPTSGQATYSTLLRAGTRPATGTYAVANIDDESQTAQSQFIVYVVDTTDLSTSTVFVSDGGQINITGSDSDVVSGEFDIPGTAVIVTPEQETREPVQINATFTATNNPALTTL